MRFARLSDSRACFLSASCSRVASASLLRSLERPNHNGFRQPGKLSICDKGLPVARHQLCCVIKNNNNGSSGNVSASLLGTKHLNTAGNRLSQKIQILQKNLEQGGGIPIGPRPPTVSKDKETTQNCGNYLKKILFFFIFLYFKNYFY